MLMDFEQIIKDCENDIEGALAEAALALGYLLDQNKSMVQTLAMIKNRATLEEDDNPVRELAHIRRQAGKFIPNDNES